MRSWQSLFSLVLLSAVCCLSLTGCGGGGGSPGANTGGTQVLEWDQLRNAGQWQLKWGDQERAFTFSHAYAALDSDGSLNFVFFAWSASAGVAHFPLAIIRVEGISSVNVGAQTPCSSTISLSDQPADLAVSPLDPLETHVIFSKKDLSVGGSVSGHFAGDLSTSVWPDLVKVTLEQGAFANVRVVREGELPATQPTLSKP